MRKINDIKYSLRRYETLQGNFTQISNSVLKIIDNCYQFTIYFYLCNMFNREYGYAFPSIRTIAAETHISVKKVQSTLKELEELGLISILKFEEKVSNTFPNNIYKVFFPVIFEEKEIFNVPSLTDEQLKQLEDVENKVRKKTLQRDEDIDD